VLESWLQSNEAAAPEPTVEEHIEWNGLSVSTGIRTLRRHPWCFARSCPLQNTKSGARGRVPLWRWVKVAKQYSQIPNWCNIADISEDGCYIEMTRPFPWGHNWSWNYELRMFELNSKELFAPATPYRYGLQFGFENEEQQRQLRKLCNFWLPDPLQRSDGA